MDLKDIQPGQLIRLKGFLQFSKAGGSLMHSEYDMSKHGYVNLGAHEIIFVVPEGFSHTSTELDTLNAAMEKHRSEFNEKMTMLRRRKRDLEMAAQKEAENANP